MTIFHGTRPPSQPATQSQMKKVTILDKSTISRQFTRDPENSPSSLNTASFDEELLVSSKPVSSDSQSQPAPQIQATPLNPHLPARSSTTNPACPVSFAVLPGPFSTARRHMYSKAADRSVAINERIERMARKWTEMDSAPCVYDELAHPSRASQDPIVTVGRIVCDSDAKLNENSVLLESSRNIGSGIKIPLNLSSCLSFSLFPGQIVMVEGVNPDGKCLHVTKFLQPGNSLMKIPKLPKAYGDYQKFTDGVLSVLVASGPFTLDSRPDLKELDFSPLDSLLSHVASKRPEVLILCGPFVDSENSALRSGGLYYLPDQIFHLEISLRLNELKEKCPEIRVILVPSQKDLHSSVDFIYPQSPLQNLKLEHNNMVTCVSNPSTFFINELCFTVSNNDILMPLAQQSISKSSSSNDRMTRICSHLLEQTSLYPLIPSANGANLDYSLLSEIELPFTPDVIISPSSIGAFARAIGSDTVCLNPGQFCRKAGMGTAALVSISAPKKLGESGSDCVPERIRVDFIQF